MKKPKTHGGKRKGSGRKTKEETKVIRVPVKMMPDIERLINSTKQKQD